MRLRLAGLIALCAGLAYLSFREDRASLPPPPGPAMAERGAAPSVTPPPGPPAGLWQEQVSRPLFVAGRRPPGAAAPAQAAPPEPPQPPPLGAAGIVVRGGSGVALLRLADGGIARVTEGEQVDGWQVVRITAEGAELRRGRETVSLNARVPTAEGLAPAN
ncbi:hypothetical protein J8J14_07085 [Roseomonas sp. SSH11]|uniref:Type II secretion system protein GspC N-terminal domain-containing protein n=1 Tax=Pararoseomonas baculiformis TaxID=2820812 RepID=A0ABS4AC03_9PROT|nr:hypothetical protein [Pararoseomonas baculiformis]MBP0444543.1 hypothetical protein [Pararoseomonas baculiformis]